MSGWDDLVKSKISNKTPHVYCFVFCSVLKPEKFSFLYIVNRLAVRGRADYHIHDTTVWLWFQRYNVNGINWIASKCWPSVLSAAAAAAVCLWCATLSCIHVTWFHPHPHPHCHHLSIVSATDLDNYPTAVEDDKMLCRPRVVEPSD